MFERHCLDDMFNQNPSLRRAAEARGWTAQGDDLVHEDGSRASGSAAVLALGALAREMGMEDPLESLRAREADFESLRALAAACRACVDQAWEEAGALSQGSDFEAESSAPWQAAYDWIFCSEVSGKARELADKVGMKFERHDPDASYRDDVVAYARDLESALSDFEGVARVGFSKALRPD